MAPAQASHGLSVVHPTAAWHPTATCWISLGQIGDQRLGRQQQARARDGVLHRRARDLDRVDHALRQHAAERAGQHVVAVARVALLLLVAALTFLEAKRQQRGSQVVTDLIVRAALRNGWRPPLREGESTSRM